MNSKSTKKKTLDWQNNEQRQRDIEREIQLKQKKDRKRAKEQQRENKLNQQKSQKNRYQHITKTHKEPPENSNPNNKQPEFKMNTQPTRAVIQKPTSKRKKHFYPR
jgi:hypothetical protein